MPQAFLCTAPAEGRGSDLTALEQGRITFVWFNNLQKVNKRVIEVKFRILREVSGSLYHLNN